jgi:hypothetical protein
LIAKRSFKEEPGNAGLFLLGRTLELRIATRMILFSSRDVAEDESRGRLAQAQDAENPCFLRVILLAYQTRTFPKKQSRRDRAAKLPAGVTLLF